MDKFSKTISLPAMTISNYGLVAKLTRSGNWTCTAFGEQRIPSVNNDSIYVWRFQMIQRTKFFAIGISSLSESWENKEKKGFYKCKYSYYYNGYNGRLMKDVGNEAFYIRGIKSLPVLQKDDILEMTFNPKHGCLSYKVDGSNTAYYDIRRTQHIEYRMVWSCVTCGDAIRILSFEIQ